MRHVTPHGPFVGLVGVLTLLVVLDRTTGLGPLGWVVGLSCGLALCLLLGTGLVRASRSHLLPADRVTLTRAVLAAGVAALVADAVPSADGTVDSHGLPAVPGAPGVVVALVALSSVALVLDAVDGRVARRTGTVHPLGARFDMETDAFLILVLSAHVARDLGWWVLGVGAARYLLMLVALAARWAPWLRGQVPARLWRKAVAAYQGIVLTLAAAGILPTATASAAVAAGLGLLVVSFGTEVVTLSRMAASRSPEAEAPGPWPGAGPTAVDVRVAP